MTTAPPGGIAVLWLLASIAAAPAVRAQDRPPAIQGTIVDAATQQVIAGAALTLLAAGEDLTTTTSGDDGVFRLFEVDEGVYQLLADAAGFQPAASGDIRVVPDKTAVVLFELSGLTLSETVVVTARAAGDDRRAPVTTTTYDREEIRRAPGSAGDVLRAIDSLPGVAATGEFASFSVRGRGPRDNLILVDGIPFDKVIHFDQTIGEQEDLDGGGRFSIFAPNLIQNIEFQPGGFAAAYGGRNGSLLKLEVAEGNPVTPTFSGRLDVAGWEFNYDGPSYVAGNTAVLFSARARLRPTVYTDRGERHRGTEPRGCDRENDDHDHRSTPAQPAWCLRARAIQPHGRQRARESEFPEHTRRADITGQWPPRYELALVDRPVEFHDQHRLLSRQRQAVRPG